MSTEKKLRRSKDQKIAGVCGGIAKYLNLDPTLVRVAYLLLSLFSAGFSGTFIYLLMWLILPEEQA